MRVIRAPAGAGTAEGPFGNDVRAAFHQARESGQPLLLEFHTAWCEVCERMARTTWRDPGVVQHMNDYVALSVNAERDPTLAARYDVEAYPTIVIAEPGGAPILVLLGLQTSEQMREHLAAVLERHDTLAAWAVAVRGKRDSAAVLGGWSTGG